MPFKGGAVLHDIKIDTNTINKRMFFAVFNLISPCRYIIGIIFKKLNKIIHSLKENSNIITYIVIYIIHINIYNFIVLVMFHVKHFISKKD